jgi:phospholipid/cholesterol/gamma-HCH transport system permease protein
MSSSQRKPTEPPLTLRIESGGDATVVLGPGWNGGDVESALAAALGALPADGKGRRLRLEDAGLDRHDTLAAANLLEVIRCAAARGFQCDPEDLPERMAPLLRLALPLPERRAPAGPAEPALTRLGRRTVEVGGAARRFVAFLGELVASAANLLRGRVRWRWRDFWVILQDCGVGALPIVSLLALLTGSILGFVGAMQLRKFGATIYMTDLVGLTMAREMAAIMTAVIMTGRTGAAFAAQIGSMNVNQEIDALETLGLSPVEYLILPRTLALVLMLPLLTLYANVLGWFGGYLVALPMNINSAEYWFQLKGSLSLEHIGFGLSKSVFFGIVVATTGCYYGLRSGRSSAAVGQATTRAVVAGITWIVVLDAVFAFMDETLNW